MTIFDYLHCNHPLCCLFTQKTIRQTSKWSCPLLRYIQTPYVSKCLDHATINIPLLQSMILRNPQFNEPTVFWLCLDMWWSYHMVTAQHRAVFVGTPPSSLLGKGLTIFGFDTMAKNRWTSAPKRWKCAKHFPWKGSST